MERWSGCGAGIEALTGRNRIVQAAVDKLSTKTERLSGFRIGVIDCPKHTHILLFSFGFYSLLPRAMTRRTGLLIASNMGMTIRFAC